MKNYLLTICVFGAVSFLAAGCSNGCVSTSFSPSFSLRTPRLRIPNLREGIERSVTNEISNQRSDLFSGVGTSNSGTSNSSISSNNGRSSSGSMFSSGNGNNSRSGNSMFSPGSNNNSRSGNSMFSPGSNNNSGGGSVGWSLY